MGDNERGAAAMDAFDELDPVSLVSHELMTPIAVISMAVETLLAGGSQLEESRRLALHMAIKRHARLMAALVHRLGTLGRLEWASLSLDLEPVDVGALVGDVVRDVTSLGDMPSIVELHLPAAPVVVPAERSAVEEIVVILLSNAMRYGQGSHIDVTVEMPDGSAVVTVRDHGPGIDVDDWDRVFEPYVRGTARGPGTGIGLTLGRGLAAAHGGTLQLRQPSSGHGCAIELALPRHPSEPLP